MPDFVAPLNRIEEQLKSISKAINNPTSSLMTFKEAAHYMKISSGHLMKLKQNGNIEFDQPSPKNHTVLSRTM